MRNNLRELLKRLLEFEIDFILVGGLASVVHGSPLVTLDIDICIAINEEQIGKLRNALKDLSPRHRMNPNFKPSFMEYPESLVGVKNIYLETNLGVLDAMSELPPLGNFERIKKDAVSVPLFGFSCKVISLEDLIAIKKTMTRPKDHETFVILSEILKKRQSKSEV